MSEDETGAPTARILEAARRRLAEGGFRDLTLRPVAEASGATMAALTYHFNSKNQLISRLVELERAADARAHEVFAGRYASLPALTPAASAALLEDYLDTAAGSARATSMIWIELLLRGANDEEARALVRPWIEERRAFWRDLLAGRVEDPEAFAQVALAYVTDETAHSLAQGEEADYRLLRRMGLERLTSRGRRVELSQPAMFEATVRRLDRVLEMPGASSEAQPFPKRAHAIAMAAGEVIVADGAEAVTHRAVGERAGAPASSVAYHFRTRLDLLRAGLAVIYLVAQGRLSAGEGPGAVKGFVVRGTLSVALAAARDPGLRPFAVDLRRLRGENLRRNLAEIHGNQPALDLCMAQAISISWMGATLLSFAADASPAGAEQVAEWLVNGALKI